LQDEEREMNELSPGIHRAWDSKDDRGQGSYELNDGQIDLTENDLTMGGDVGVTLRCAIYIRSVGIVHELCSSRTVTAVLCVQRLSGKRPLSEVCPPSAHHTWLLINRQGAKDNSTVSITGLKQCHHQHLGQTYCHPKNGWSKTICPAYTVQKIPHKHHGGKKNHIHYGIKRGHYQQDQKLSKPLKGSSAITLGKKYENFTDRLMLYSPEIRRAKRTAEIPTVDGVREEGWHTAPLAKAETLNLDFIESIMQDFTSSKKKKKNQNSGKQESDKTTTPAPKQISQVSQNNSAKSDVEQTVLEENIKNTEIKFPVPIQQKNPEKEKENGEQKIMVGTGPIFVQEPRPQSGDLQASESDEPMDEGLPSSNNNENMEPVKTLETTGDTPIVFPEIPGVSFDPTPRSINPVGDESFNIEESLSSFEENMASIGESDMTTLPSLHEIIFPRSDTEVGENGNSQQSPSILHNNVTQKPQYGIAELGIGNEPGASELGNVNVVDESVKDVKSEKKETTDTSLAEDTGNKAESTTKVRDMQESQSTISEEQYIESLGETTEEMHISENKKDENDETSKGEEHSMETENKHLDVEEMGNDNSVKEENENSVKNPDISAIGDHNQSVMTEHVNKTTESGQSMEGEVTENSREETGEDENKMKNVTIAVERGMHPIEEETSNSAMEEQQFKNNNEEEFSKGMEDQFAVEEERKDASKEEIGNDTMEKEHTLGIAEKEHDKDMVEGEATQGTPTVEDSNGTQEEDTSEGTLENENIENIMDDENNKDKEAQENMSSEGNDSDKVTMENSMREEHDQGTIGEDTNMDTMKEDSNKDSAGENLNNDVNTEENMFSEEKESDKTIMVETTKEEHETVEEETSIGTVRKDISDGTMMEEANKGIEDTDDDKDVTGQHHNKSVDTEDSMSTGEKEISTGITPNNFGEGHDVGTTEEENINGAMEEAKTAETVGDDKTGDAMAEEPNVSNDNNVIKEGMGTVDENNEDKVEGTDIIKTEEEISGQDESTVGVKDMIADSNLKGTQHENTTEEKDDIGVMTNKHDNQNKEENTENGTSETPVSQTTQDSDEINNKGEQQDTDIKKERSDLDIPLRDDNDGNPFEERSLDEQPNNVITENKPPDMEMENANAEVPSTNTENSEENKDRSIIEEKNKENERQDMLSQKESDKHILQYHCIALPAPGTVWTVKSSYS
ncbi:hypothetical protein SK128_025064, partial [Halocaridina rubra]